MVKTTQVLKYTFVTKNSYLKPHGARVSCECKGLNSLFTASDIITLHGASVTSVHMSYSDCSSQQTVFSHAIAAFVNPANKPFAYLKTK